MLTLKNLKNLFSPEAGRSAELEEAIREARGEAARKEDRFSAAARARIVAEVSRGGAAPESWPAVFAPQGRLVLAGGLPLVLAGALLVLMDRSGIDRPPVANPETVVQVAKVGDRVEFTIRNGRKGHYVYRSTAPDRFDGRDGVRVTDGSYVERLADGSALVFYRIE